VALQLGEVIEWIRTAQFSRVDQAHEQVSNTRAVLRAIEQTRVEEMKEEMGSGLLFCDFA
jgi:hypothetical protein